MSALTDRLLAGDARSGRYYEVLRHATVDDGSELLELARHTDPAVRSALVGTLPLLAATPPPGWVECAIDLTTDADPHVRDQACFVLAEQWRGLDTPELREALAGCLDDPDRDTRCEALVGLAYRQDERALPRVRAALSREDGDVWSLELVAAGALGDPELHPLVQRHLDGWDDEQQRTVEAVNRLTDPDGPGQDLFVAMARLCACRAAGQTDDAGDLVGWSTMLDMLEIAPHRAREFFDGAAVQLRDDPTGLAELTSNSALAQLAGETD